jgi:hypothetical protein
MRFLLAALLLVGGLTGCTKEPAEDDEGARPVTRLVATLTTPTDAALTWKAAEPTAAGRIVEFATEPAGQYAILQFLGPEQTTFTHPDLMPKTPFYYRLRPYFGLASGPVQVNLPKGELTAQAQPGEQDWASPRTLPGGPAGTSSLHVSPGGAVPTGLKATVMNANGIRFTWTDHAKDEDGYLLEVKPAGRDSFAVATVLDPDVNSFGLVTLPEEKSASYRVRAFYYGPSSNIAHVTTGAEQP